MDAAPLSAPVAATLRRVERISSRASWWLLWFGCADRSRSIFARIAGSRVLTALSSEWITNRSWGGSWSRSMAGLSLGAALIGWERLAQKARNSRGPKARWGAKRTEIRERVATAAG